MVEHLYEIEFIREIEKQYFIQHNTKVVDVSHWNPGQNYVFKLFEILRLPSIDFDPQYVYSYELPSIIKEEAQKRLGVKENGGTSVIFFQNGTIAQVNVINFLASKRFKKICILEPSYFNVSYIMDRFGLNAQKLSLEFLNGNYTIPFNTLVENQYDAVWITSPIYSSGCYFNDIEIQKIKQLLELEVFIIVDECVSLIGNEIYRKIGTHKNLISIVCPHKTIIINAIKFSAIICNEEYEDYFNVWLDLFSGGLLESNIIAIKHFISSNYRICQEFMKKHTDERRTEIEQILNLSGSSNYIKNTSGQYCTLFYRDIPFEISTQRSFIERAINETGVSFIPGYLNGYGQKLGFGFRVNLSINKDVLLSSILNLDKYLNGIICKNK